MTEEKKNKIFGVSFFLVVIFSVAVVAIGYMYLMEKQNLADKISVYAKLKSDYNSNIARNIDLNNKLQKAVKDSEENVKLLGDCTGSNCLLSSRYDEFFGLAEIKGYYQEKCIKENDSDFGNLDYCCPLIVITQASNQMIDGLKDDGGSWIMKNNDGSIKNFTFNFGILSPSEKNKIKASTKDNPVDLTMFADQLQDGVGFEGAQCLTPWKVITIN